MVNHLLQTTGIDLTNGGGVGELIQFQEHYKVTVSSSMPE